jgi:hypothetical protein
MYHIDPARVDLLLEYLEDPLRDHRAEVRELATFLLQQRTPDKLVIITQERHRSWYIGRYCGRRGTNIEILRDQRFDSLLEAGREVIRRRWETMTGVAIVRRADPT